MDDKEGQKCPAAAQVKSAVTQLTILKPGEISIFVSEVHQLPVGYVLPLT